MNFRTIIFSLLAGHFVFAAQLPKVIINEIAWAGTPISPNDEWIELYNQTDVPINLEGWQLKAIDQTPTIKLAGVIEPLGFYLLERTDDESVPNLPADQIYKGALSNSGEHLQLFDQEGNLIDEINARDGWLAGDNQSKQTLERTLNGKWQTSTLIEGTPKKTNSPGVAIITPAIEKDSRQESSRGSKEQPLPSPQSSGNTSMQDENLSASLNPETFEQRRSKYFQNNDRFFSILAVALVLAGLASFSILLLKRKLLKLNETRSR